MGGGRQTGAGRSTQVERLVDRVADGERDDPRWSALLRVLTAASRGAEVDPEREQAAVIAFRAAATAGPPRGVRARRRRSLRSVRALAGGIAAVFAICGVAFAAGTGHLPARGHAAHGGPPAAPAPATAPAPAAPAPAHTGAASGSTPGSPPGATFRTSGPGPGATAEPPPHTKAAAPARDRSQAAVRSLCRVYLAALRDGRAPAWQPPARLKREAGGSRRVAAYCRALLPPQPGAAVK